MRYSTARSFGYSVFRSTGGKPGQSWIDGEVSDEFNRGTLADPARLAARGSFEGWLDNSPKAWALRRHPSELEKR